MIDVADKARSKRVLEMADRRVKRLNHKPKPEYMSRNLITVSPQDLATIDEILSRAKTHLSKGRMAICAELIVQAQVTLKNLRR